MSGNALPVSDQSLLRRLRTGDEEAATELYRRYAPRLKALARGRFTANLARRTDVDDILQSVFRRFFVAARQGNYELPSGQDLWNLLLVITLNRLRAEEQFHRAAKRDVRHSADLDSLSSTEQPQEPSGRTSVWLNLALRDALAELPPSHREVVELRMEGYDVASIAENIGRSKRSVERILQESRTRLRHLLNEE